MFFWRERMDNKAQGALEYLLLIGGAIVIAVLVISIVSGLGNRGANIARQQMDRFANFLNSIGPRNSG
jgi:uncharacterized protein (UPF0333 family)